MDQSVNSKLQNLVDKFLRDAEYFKTGIKVKDFMRPNPSCLTTDSQLKDAIRIMAVEGVDAVPIVDADDSAIGIVTKTLALREINISGDINKPIIDVMKKNPLVTHPQEDSVHLLKIPIGNIPVVENKCVVGLVSLSDTIRATFSAVFLLQEELKTIVNSAHSGILAIDTNGHLRIINPAAQRIFQISTNEYLLGMQIPDKTMHEKCAKVMKEGKSMLGEKLLIQNKAVFTSICTLIHDNEIIGAVAMLQDISELESVSEELKYTKELKSEMDAIIESSFDGIYVTDSFGKILRVNNAFIRITGIKREEVIDKTARELVDIGIFRQHPPLHVIAEGKPVTFSQEVKTGKTILVTSSPVLESNNIIRIVYNARDITELNSLKNQLEKAESLNLHYRDQLEIIKLPTKYVAKSARSKTLIELVMRLSKIDATILLLGESGVGKDVIAEILHENSTRKDKLMISINCAAIPENLLESELFGYAPGAFTGADRKGKVGSFELANGSTLFLDEIGELPLSLQSKLLRVLQKKEIRKLGGSTSTLLDVRIIAATNRDLEAMVATNGFRRDLYYRLNVIPITVPPLRERKEEIPDFVYHFTRLFNDKYEFNKQFDERVIYEFLDYDWPGNIRELENVIERSMIMSQDNLIHNADISYGSPPNKKTSCGLQDYFININHNYKRAMEHFDKEVITDALTRFGTTRRAADALGMSQPTLVRKAAKYKIKTGKAI